MTSHTIIAKHKKKGFASLGKVTLDDTFKAATRFLRIFPKTRKHHDWDYVGHHDHTLQYKTIIKHVYTWRNSLNLLILAQFAIPSLFCDPQKMLLCFTTKLVWNPSAYATGSCSDHLLSKCTQDSLLHILTTPFYHNYYSKNLHLLSKTKNNQWRLWWLFISH